MQDLFTNRLARDKNVERTKEREEEKHRVFRRCNFLAIPQLHSQQAVNAIAL